MYAPFVARGDLVFDVGAHLGDRTAAFAGLGARVLALEPQPHIVSWLRRLVGRRPGVTIRSLAVGRVEGVARMALSGAHPTVSTLAAPWRERVLRSNPSFRHVRWEEGVDVRVTTMDALISEFGMPRFCKIDVEGHEAEVLAGLSRPVEALSVEFVSGGLEVGLSCVDRLAELAAYRYNVVVGEGRRFHFDEWLDPDAVRRWFRDGAEGLSSGDLYARRVGADVQVLP
jgi:FkbM family methyltransferase